MTGPHTDERLLDAARALARRAGFPRARLRPLHRGLSSDLFLVLERGHHTPSAIVKCFRGLPSRVHAASAALRWLAEARLGRIPTVLLSAPHHVPPAMVLSWVGGRPHTLEEARPVARDALGRQLGAWTARMHECSVEPGDVKMSSDPLTLPERLLAQCRRAQRRTHADHPCVRLIDDAVAWLETTIPEDRLLRGPRRMTHRDLRPHNVVVAAHGHDGPTIAGVVDFEHAAAAHPAWDFAKLQWWCFDRLEGLREPFLCGYRAIRELPHPTTQKLFRVFEATTLLAYFAGKHPIYEREARRQLEAELSGAPRPAWRGDWSTARKRAPYSS